MLALIAFLGMVAVVPAWMFFTYQHPALSAVSTETRFMFMLVMPVTSMLLLASWFNPGGVLG